MLIDQLVLVLAACALGGAALRVGARIQPTASGGAGDVSLIELVLIAAPLAAAFVVCWTLAIGLAGLAGSPVALAAGPIVAWAAVRALLPERRPRVLRALIGRWNRASPRQRIITMALAGLAGGCALELARRPGLDIDALTYHLADVVGWLHSGHAGRAQTLSYDFPLGYYPVTGEILLTWVLGISRSFAPLAAWPVTLLVLTLLAMWRFLHLLRVPRAVAVAALATFAALPAMVVNLNLGAPGTDLPAVGWLAVTAALVAGAPASPRLLAPAVLAAGLGIGTKTTVAPMAVILLLWGVWRVRGRLRPARWWLVGGMAGALLVGVPWYVRNTLAHGWPLWPFSSGPTGDPLPHAMSLFHASFLSRAGPSVRAIGGQYRDWLAGGLGLIVGMLAIPLIARTRSAVIAAALALGSVFVWAAAPFTGVAPDPLLQLLAVSTIRYMLPALGVCVVALAVAGRDASPPGRRFVVGLLAAATIGSIVSDIHFGFPISPTPTYLLAGAGAGLVLGALVSVRRLPVITSPWRWAAAVLAVAALTLAAPGWLWRESEDGSYNHAVLGFMMGQPGFISGSQPVSFAPAVLASLAGPRLRHATELIPAREPCSAVEARLRHGWIVVWPDQFVAGINTPFDAAACLRDDHPIYDRDGTVVYGPSS